MKPSPQLGSWIKDDSYGYGIICEIEPINPKYGSKHGLQDCHVFFPTLNRRMWIQYHVVEKLLLTTHQ